MVVTFSDELIYFLVTAQANDDFLAMIYSMTLLEQSGFLTKVY